HRRVDAPDGEVTGIEERREHAVARDANGVHHPVASDRDDPRDLLEWNGGRTTELARRVRLHGLHDVAAKVAVLLAARLDGRAQIGAPDDLVGVALDVVALEEGFAPPVAGKVEDPGPVGPIKTIGSPGARAAQSLELPPISSTIVPSRPFSLSTHAPVSASPSIDIRALACTSGMPFPSPLRSTVTMGAYVSKFWRR